MFDEALARSLPRFLAGQRWFGGKGRTISACSVDDVADLTEDGELRLVICRVSYVDGMAERYALVVACRQDPGGLPAIGRLDAPDGRWLVEATTGPRAAAELLRGFGGGVRLTTHRGGRLEFGDVGAEAARVFRGEPPAIAPIGAEQSNTSLRVGRSFIFKLFRRGEAGENPEVELGRFLSARTAFRAMPALEGSLTYRSPEGEASTIGVLQGWVESRGDGWTFVLEMLAAARSAGQAPPSLPADLAILGRVTAEFHAALESDRVSEAFRPEPARAEDLRAWTASIGSESARAKGLIEAKVTSWPEETRSLGESVIAALAARASFVSPSAKSTGPFDKIRIHGDFHLGQTLKTREGFALIDFEGEPAKPLEERRMKFCALKDVAGMLRSFDYAIETAGEGDQSAVSRLRGLVDLRRPFLDAYLETAVKLDSHSLPRDRGEVLRWLALFELEKAIYELEYEINNRPAWVAIPLRGIIAALAGQP